MSLVKVHKSLISYSLKAKNNKSLIVYYIAIFCKRYFLDKNRAIFKISMIILYKIKLQ